MRAEDDLLRAMDDFGDQRFFVALTHVCRTKADLYATDGGMRDEIELWDDITVALMNFSDALNRCRKKRGR